MADADEAHQVGGAAGGEGGAGDEADDVAFLDEFFFEEALLAGFGEQVEVGEALDAARLHAPEKSESTARFAHGGEGNDRRARAVFGDEAGGRTRLGEDGDDAEMQFFGGVADGFGDGFVDLQICGCAWVAEAK